MKNHKQNIQDFWDSINRVSLQIMGIVEGKEVQDKGIQSILNKIIVEQFPHLGKELVIKAQDPFRTQNRKDH
jgi:hypothetical protein